ncbi:Cache 3/Cache 2 fusion domain-containing protein [Methylobacterium sp. P31]
MKTPLLTLSLLAALAGVAVPMSARVAAGPAEDVQTAMQRLKAKTAELGAPSVKGEDSVAGKAVPALYFGQTKMNNNFAVVDAVQKDVGGTATLFVKSGGEFVRVATNVKKDDGSRAIGTVLDPKGKAFAAITKGEAYFGDADILGKPYKTGYEPIRDASSGVIGIYYVGYPKK